MYIFNVKKDKDWSITAQCLVSIKYKDIINRPHNITSVEWGKEKRSHVSKSEWYLVRAWLKLFVKWDDMLMINKGKMRIPVRIKFNSPMHFHSYIIPYQLNFPFKMHDKVKEEYESWFNEPSLSHT